MLSPLAYQVYKGKLIDSTLISIKSMKMRKRYNSQILMHHIELISKLRHNHLVSALGHCLQYDTDTSNVSCIHLIFEFVPNVPLRNCLSGKLISNLFLHILSYALPFTQFAGKNSS